MNQQRRRPSPGRTMGTSLLTCSLLGLLSTCSGFSSPKITRDSMAGLWKLTGITSELSSIDVSEQHYIKLNDDGSFQAVNGKESMLGLSTMQGTWGYRDGDGQLILAAERPKDANVWMVHDTILEGKVHYKQTEAMSDDESASLVEEQKNPAQKKVQTWFTVPMGSISIGKFFYPRKHPSFFDNPIYNPTNMGTFQLAQVLSNHPVEVEDTRFVEKFRREDFMGKKFWLTSYPIPDPKPKGRWSIKYGKYVQDASPKDEEAATFPIPIRVLQVVFYSNYTFAITDGVGSAVKLRGKWDIWGEERDLFYMQILRFGFGRDVSGSVYSEGQSLSHEDCKWYRGSIKEGGSGDDGNENDGAAGGDSLIVKGEVYLGKVTPCREGLFMLKEAHDEDEEDDDDDDDDDDVRLIDLPDSSPPTNWSDAFQ
jgi:hypothetical protein